MKNYFILLFIWGLCSAPPAYAETTWQVAPGRSTVQFKVKHFVFMVVEGRFKKFEGKVITENEEFTYPKVEASIKSDSIYTGNHDRDKDLISEEFFYAHKYPEITFKTTSSIETGEKDTYKIVGNLTMRGVTKPIELIATCKYKKVLSNGKTRLDFVATGSLNRFDYGLRWNEFMETGNAVVGENVDIVINIALLKE